MTKLDKMRSRSWDFDPKELLYSYVGAAFSYDDLDEIMASKSTHEANHVADMIELKPTDVVLDVGSGYGHIAAGLAPRVKSYICADISSNMMEHCKKSTENLSNISYEIFPRPNIMGMSKYSPNKIFSNSVFIHMTMFEIVSYMRQCYNLLPPGGIMYFNFQDADFMAGGDDPVFEDMLSRYLADPEEVTLMHWNSFQAIRGIAQRIGFEVRYVRKHQYSATSVSLIRYT